MRLWRLTLVACWLLSVGAVALLAWPPSVRAASQKDAHTPLVYVAIGASDAFGIGTDHPKEENWPRQLSQALGTPIHLIDLGIPGATLDVALRDELPITVDAQPQIVTIWLAVNDLNANVPLATYADQLRSMVMTLHQRTSAAIYVADIPDLTLLPSFAGTDLIALHTTVLAWNAAITGVCQSMGATLIDLYSAWSDLATHPEYISGDGFHPSTQGARRLAAIFAQAIGPLATH